MTNKRDRHNNTAQLRQDTKRVFQVLMPHLPLPLIDMTTRVIWKDHHHAKPPTTKPRYHLRRPHSEYDLFTAWDNPFPLLLPGPKRNKHTVDDMTFKWHHDVQKK